MGEYLMGSKSLTKADNRVSLLVESMAPARVPWGLMSTKIPKSHVSPSHLCGPFLGGPLLSPAFLAQSLILVPPQMSPSAHGSVLLPPTPRILPSAPVWCYPASWSCPGLLPSPPLPWDSSPALLAARWSLRRGSGHRYALGTLVVKGLLWLPRAHAKESPPLRLPCQRPGHVWVCMLPAWPTA